MQPHDRTASDLAEHIEMETLHDRNGELFNTVQKQSPKRKAYFIGIGLLLIVVLLWTLSNFVTQDLYESGYDKPFFVTYTNTTSFSFYLIPLLIRRWQTRGHDQERQGSEEYQPLHQENESEDASITSQMPSLEPLTIRQTADLAFAFCLLWFIANWTVNAALSYTSVASATVLSSVSGFFTLGIGRLFRVEKMTLPKIAAVCSSFIGVTLVSLSDSTSKSPAGPVAHPGAAQARIVDSRATFGDFLALTSALFYALYVILLKVKIKSESRIDMQLFFGFVGLLNFVTCWPLGLILHLTKLEVFELPPSRKALQAILVNMVITLSSDYLYVLAMLKTTPLVVTIGLSLTIPVAVVGDFVRLRPVHAQVIAGALIVLASFMAIGIENSKPEKREVQQMDEQ